MNWRALDGRLLWGGLAVWLLGVSLFIAPAAEAAEPAREFLEMLRRNGYHDMAVEYLDRMKSSKLAPVELKEVLLYERGVTLIDGSNQVRDPAARTRQFDEAQAALEQFIKLRPRHPLAMSAQSELGNLLQKRATLLVDQANSPSGRSKKSALLKQARDMYEEAYQVFEKSAEALKKKLASRKKVYDPKTEKAEIEARDRERRDYLQAQLLAAAIKEEMAATEPEGSEASNKLLSEAAAAYGEIYEKYRTRLAGLYARMYQGRANQKLGKLVDALSYYDELLEQPDSPDAFRGLKTKTLLLAMECWLDPEQKKYTEAVAQGSAWVAKARPNELRDVEWLQLRLITAQALKLYSDELRKKKPKDPQASRAVTEARKLANVVAKYPGDLQDEARKLLAQLRGGEVEEDDKVDPKTFAEAKDAGKEALESLQTASYVLREVPARLAKETDANVKAEMQKQVDEAKQTLATARDDARRYFQLALKFVDKETPLDDVNVVRYFLCYLYYMNNDFYDAAIMGEFLARRYPASAGARQSAKIALASYLKLYADAQGDDKTFEIDHTMQVADYIVEKWPKEPEAVDALNTLIPFALQRGQLMQAAEYLDSIPDGSPQRAASALKVGQSMWSAYLRGLAELRAMGDEVTPERQQKQQQLVELKKVAETTLKDGVARSQAAGTIDEVLATALLSLAQLHVENDEPQKAVALLESDSAPLLSLVEKKHPATQKAGFAQETYKTALRAYIASLAANPDDNAPIAKAKQVMESLKQAAGSTPEGQKQLIAIYISMARGLKDQMDQIQSPTAKKTLSQGFANFLANVGEGSDELNVLNWVAETFAGMGESFKSGANPSPEDAKVYLTKAADSYEQILKRGEGKPDWLSPEMALQVRMRLATVYRQINKFNGAMDIFEQILLAKPMTLNVQVEAARTYQTWAEAPGKEALYDRAMKGGRPDKKTKKNTVWGWIKLSQLVGRYPKFRDTFHEARYNLALCHLEYGLRKSPTEKSKYLKFAENDIKVTQKLYPELGGDTWKPRYDKLLRRIQREKGEEVVGLEKTASTN